MISQFSQSKFLIPAMVLIAVMAGATGFFISVKQAEKERLESQVQIPGLFWPNPRQIGEFETVDHRQASFGLPQLQGKWSFVFFGYTNCPDICPITLSMMANIYPELSEKVDNVQVLFVSVDPERDSTETLAQYVNYFDPNFIGLGGSESQISSMTRQLGVAYFIDKEEDNENYLVDHSASLYLISPEASMVGKLSPPLQPDSIKQQFYKIKEFIDAQS